MCDAVSCTCPSKCLFQSPVLEHDPTNYDTPSAKHLRASCQAQPMHSHTGSSIRWKPKPAQGVAIGHHDHDQFRGWNTRLNIQDCNISEHVTSLDDHKPWWCLGMLDLTWRKATSETSEGFLEFPTKTRKRVFGTLPMGCCGVMSNRTVLMPWKLQRIQHISTQINDYPFFSISCCLAALVSF